MTRTALPTWIAAIVVAWLAPGSLMAQYRHDPYQMSRLPSIVPVDPREYVPVDSPDPLLPPLEIAPWAHANPAGVRVAEVARDALPLEPEEIAPVEVDPPLHWYDLHYWCSPKVWDASLELGINGSSGNSDSFSMRAGGKVKRSTEASIISFNATAANTKSDGVETQNNALADLRVEWPLAQSRWSLFTAGSLEYDEFKAFDLRVAANAGVGYDVINNEATKLQGTYGAGASREIGGPDDDVIPEAVFGLELTHQLSARQKIAAKTEYFPNWGNWNDYRIRSEAGWEVLLDEGTNLSLKFGAINRYDSTSFGRKHSDLDYSALLIWKL